MTARRPSFPAHQSSTKYEYLVAYTHAHTATKPYRLSSWAMCVQHQSHVCTLGWGEIVFCANKRGHRIGALRKYDSQIYFSHFVHFNSRIFEDLLKAQCKKLCKSLHSLCKMTRQT